MKLIPFYAGVKDLESFVESIDANNSLRYYLTRNYSKDEVQNGIVAYDKGAMIPNLGWASAGSGNICDSFLVCDRTSPMVLRTIHGNGDNWFSVDQLLNPDTIEFTPAGIWNDKIVISGRVATVSETTSAQALMRLFSKTIKHQFTRVKSYYVGPEALSLLKSGHRLTPAANAAPMIDLVLLPHNGDPFKK